MPKVRSALSLDGSFVLDGVTVPAIRAQIESALDAWYKLHPDVVPALWVSTQMHATVQWCVRHVCKSLSTPVNVYVEQRDKYTGRLAA